MKYKNYNIAIPASKRATINDKILALIDTGELQGITHEEIFNSYTGIGGLHDLSFDNYANRHEYTEAKKEIEQGQFFTPAAVAQQMASLISLKNTESIADLTAGAGVFINFFPEHQFYGCEIDPKAHKVAKFLFPASHIKLQDIRAYEPAMLFNYIIGNPPFNLRWQIKGKAITSQTYFFKKAAELLRPGGLIMAIVPASFCADEFANKSDIDNLNESFNLLFQIGLDDNAFQQLGVTGFGTKIIALQKRSEHITDISFTPTFSNWAEAAEMWSTHAEIARTLKVKINAEVTGQDDGFAYRVKKYLYEIKTHPTIQEKYSAAVAYLHKFETQQCPDGMKYEEWAKKHRVTKNMVLSYLKRIVKMQNRKSIDKIELVKTQYGFKLKAYSGKSKAILSQQNGQKQWRMSDLIYYNHNIPNLPKGYQNLLNRKRKAHEAEVTPYPEAQATPLAASFLKSFGWFTGDVICRFNDKQKSDLGKVFTKAYTILNWQQGCGKTPAAFAWSKYQTVKKFFIVSNALSINLTWTKFLTANEQTFVNIRSREDITRIANNTYVIISHEMLVIYAKAMAREVKKLSHKIGWIMDESDETTNHNAKRTRAARLCFRKAQRKLFTTGTTTRNNIAELYSQLELLYNNSANLICECPTIFTENRTENKIEEDTNDYFGYPFPAYYGNSLFKSCFNPSKSTVLGIGKQNQDIYNEEHLRRLISRTIITRKFKDIAGDKYSVQNIGVRQSNAERNVYRSILREFHELVQIYFRSTGNARKDSQLRIIRQIKLLIDATSTPQLFQNYEGNKPPNKAIELFSRFKKLNERICIGCTSRKAVSWYRDELKTRFPDRPIFVITGTVPVTKRGEIIKEFEASANGILVATQQSLKSSVNIPECDHVFVESLQWNIPKIEQFYFRFIRFNSRNHTKVYFICYHDTIEANLLALLMTKEKLNDYIKTLEYRTNSDIYNEFDIDMGILDSLITKETDAEGNVKITWGKAEVF